MTVHAVHARGIFADIDAQVDASFEVAALDVASVDAGPRVVDDRAVRHRTVVIVVFDQVQGLDVFGPADVFYFANFLAERAEHAPPYDVHLAAATTGPVRTASGPVLHADRSVFDPGLRPDVLLVAGGLAVDRAAGDPAFVAALGDLASRSKEVGSVCTGALLLAEAGLLSGRRATTHWALADRLADNHPEVRVDADSLYLLDGVWTSAGVTAGIDLALQLVRMHHGSRMASDVARHLVVYLQRAGGQRQYSSHLAAQQATHPTIADLLAYVADHPEADLTVRALANRTSMSERSFQRLFTRETGMTPARYVEVTRLDLARGQLERTDDPLVAIARRCGFSRLETFHRSFVRIIGIRPSDYRARFRDGQPLAGYPMTSSPTANPHQSR